MNSYDKRADELIEMIWQSFIKDWEISDCQEPEYVNDYLNETLWEALDKLDLDLAFYILASNPVGLDWGFFKDMYSDCSNWDGPYAVKNTALQMIWDDHLIPRAEAFQAKLLEKPKNNNQTWKGTLDPQKINWIAQIPPEDRKDNRSNPYNRHPC
jgi:hypothetical protein